MRTFWVMWQINYKHQRWYHKENTAICQIYLMIYRCFPSEEYRKKGTVGVKERAERERDKGRQKGQVRRVLVLSNG